MKIHYWVFVAILILATGFTADPDLATAPETPLELEEAPRSYEPVLVRTRVRPTNSSFSTTWNSRVWNTQSV